MTYAQSIEIALMRIDSEQGDYNEDLIPSIADTAQKQIAIYGKGVERIKTIEKDNREDETFEMPIDFYRLLRMERRDSLEPIEYYWIGNKTLVLRSRGIIDIYYYAMPQTIDESITDEYEYEVPLETHNAIPYFIGYELAKADDPTLAQMCLNEWNKYMSIFANEPSITKKKIVNHYGLR